MTRRAAVRVRFVEKARTDASSPSLQRGAALSNQ
jgi:hypothetical protein